MHIKLLIYSFVFAVFIVSCGSSGNGFINGLKKDSQKRSVLIIKNASKLTMQSIELAKKSFTYRKEELPKGLNCLTLGFSKDKTTRDINLSLVSSGQWTKGDFICEIDDYKNFDKSISGEFNTIFILDK